MKLFSIGHGKAEIHTFIGLLQQHKIELLVDTRSQPYSRFNPHFNRETLGHSMRAANLTYYYLGNAIGGRPQGEQFYLSNRRINYDRLEQAEFYQSGIRQLLEFAAESRVAFMCSEMNYQHCHRYHLITRTLVRRGIEVHHILPSGATVGSVASDFVTSQITLF